MQQSKAYVIKNATRNLKATMAARKANSAMRCAEYAAYRYGSPLAGGNDYQPQKRPTREERKATHG